MIAERNIYLQHNGVCFGTLSHSSIEKRTGLWVCAVVITISRSLVFLTLCTYEYVVCICIYIYIYIYTCPVVYHRATRKATFLHSSPVSLTRTTPHLFIEFEYPTNKQARLYWKLTFYDSCLYISKLVFFFGCQCLFIYFMNRRGINFVPYGFRYKTEVVVSFVVFVAFGFPRCLAVTMSIPLRPSPEGRANLTIFVRLFLFFLYFTVLWYIVEDYSINFSVLFTTLYLVIR